MAESESTKVSFFICCSYTKYTLLELKTYTGITSHEVKERNLLKN